MSFSLQFMFVKTVKTAGTSLEVHLARVCGEDDIVTPIFPANALHRPRNYGVDYFNHMPASALRNLLPQAFATSFKFCFERHPIDKCLSHFAMLKNSPEHRRVENPATWEDYLELGDFPLDTQRYCDENGKLLVDRIYRYEDIDGAIRDLERRLGRTIGPLRVREKSGFRFDTPRFTDVIANARQRVRIMDAFASQLRLTPYA